MGEKCAITECLRETLTAGTACVPCQKGFPPMKNPKSPHAYSTKPPTSGTPKEPIKPSKTEKKEKPSSKKGWKQEDWKKGKTSREIKEMQKNAVQLIFATYWYGWPDGLPPAFVEIFKPYGNFISVREIPSQMQGTPEIHRSTINAKGKKAFVLVVEAIYPMEGEARAFNAIKLSPIMMEALGDVSPTDAIEMVKNDGKPFTFTKDKKDGSQYYYMDDGGKKRTIPRWAIA